MLCGMHISINNNADPRKDCDSIETIYVYCKVVVVSVLLEPKPNRKSHRTIDHDDDDDAEARAAWNASQPEMRVATMRPTSNQQHKRDVAVITTLHSVASSVSQ